jgi:hypothetical protein
VSGSSKAVSESSACRQDLSIAAQRGSDAGPRRRWPLRLDVGALKRVSRDLAGLPGIILALNCADRGQL